MMLEAMTENQEMELAKIICKKKKKRRTKIA